MQMRVKSETRINPILNHPLTHKKNCMRNRDYDEGETEIEIKRARSSETPYSVKTGMTTYGHGFAG